jgi:hypothetical protein
VSDTGDAWGGQRGAGRAALPTNLVFGLSDVRAVSRVSVAAWRQLVGHRGTCEPLVQKPAALCTLWQRGLWQQQQQQDRGLCWQGCLQRTASEDGGFTQSQKNAALVITPDNCDQYSGMSMLSPALPGIAFHFSAGAA